MNSSRGKIFLETLRESGIIHVFLEGRVGQRRQSSSNPTETLHLLKENVMRCTKCEDLLRNRHSVVFGSGDCKAKLVFVGEAPGREEDRQGVPFVGAAGQLLTKMIEAMGLHREEVFIANVLKCRPPGNRPPKPKEIENCEPYLTEQLALIQPKVICALGTFAAQTLLKSAVPISGLRGRVFDYQGVSLLCTFHPAYLLRNPSEKKKAWEDLKRVKSLLEER